MIQINNCFTQYELTEDEQALGYYLSPEQRAVIQNDIADIAIQRAGIVHDLANPSKSLLEDAALKGQLTILQYMLSRSDAVMASRNLNKE